LPVYFIGGWGTGCRKTLARLLEDAAAGRPTSLRHLGRAGIAKVKGLQVAYLDGQFSSGGFASDDLDPTCCHHFTQGDVQTLRDSLEAAAGDIDFFLTNEWPAGILRSLSDAQKPAQGTIPGSCPPVTDLAKAVRPRYHIAGCSPAFYARPPYLNPDLGLGSHVTRFVSLAATGNAAKQKSLHALAVTPAAVMSAEQLRERPADTTAFPFPQEKSEDDKMDRKRAALEKAAGQGLGDQQWRWQSGPNKKQRMQAAQAAPSRGSKDVIRDQRKTIFLRNLPKQLTERELLDFLKDCGEVLDVRRGLDKEGRIQTWAHVQFSSVEAAGTACALSGAQLMGREVHIERAQLREHSMPVQPFDGCWFCLSNPSAATWLIASVAQETYLTLDKSPIDPATHVLIVPIEHYPSTMRMPMSAYKEVRDLQGFIVSACSLGMIKWIDAPAILAAASCRSLYCSPHIVCPNLLFTAGRALPVRPPLLLRLDRQRAPRL
jgi:hypothetical protein